MTKKEALAKLFSGETTKVRNSSWVEGYFILIDDGELVNSYWIKYTDIWALDENEWETMSMKEVEHTYFFNIYEDRASIPYITKEAAEQCRNEEKFLETREVIFKVKKEDWVS